MYHPEGKGEGTQPKFKVVEFSEETRIRADWLMKVCEANHHELRSIDANPVSGETDYAPACQWVSVAMRHLDEALPIGQAERGRRSFELAELGLTRLRRWMKVKGYF